MSVAGFNFPQATLDYRTEVAIGSVSNVASFGKYGQRINIGNNNTEDVWCADDDIRFDLVSPERMSIVSTSDADVFGGGGGANTILVYGVDGDWNEVIETVELNGTTPVLTIATMLRVNFLLTASTGGQGNDGDITIASEITDHVQDIVPAGDGYSCSTFYSVPKGRRILIPNIHCSIDRREEGQLVLKVKTVTNSDSYITAFKMYLFESTISLTDQYFSFDEMTDIKFQVETLTGGLSTNCFYSIFQFPKT